MYVPSLELGLSQPLSRQRVCPFPQNRGPGGGGGGHTRLRVRGWGSPNSDDWRKSLALCLLYGRASQETSCCPCIFELGLRLLSAAYTCLVTTVTCVTAVAGAPAIAGIPLFPACSHFCKPTSYCWRPWFCRRSRCCFRPCSCWPSCCCCCCCSCWRHCCC
jgi:hypothetical protein